MDDKVLEIILRARDEASKTLQKVGKETSDLGDLMRGSFKNAAMISGVALGALGLEAVRAVGAFNESQEALTQLDAVLESTGGKAGVTRKQVLALAQEFSQFTKFSDDASLSGQNLLLTFTNIGEEVFPDATEVMLDMSQALGQDLKASAIQLGKALNDPILGVTALRRVGVAFTEEQQEQIKVLVESGKTYEAQRMILDELNMEFGQSAEMAGTTFSGQLTILKNAVGELEEKLGEFIVKALAPLLEKLVPLTFFISDIIAGQNKLSELTPRLTKDFGALGTVVGNTVTFFAENKEATIALAGAIGGFLVISIIAATVAMAAFIGLSLPVIALFAAIGAGIAILILHWNQLSATVNALRQYFLLVVRDGDYLNDWLTNLPAPMENVVRGLGRLISWFITLRDTIVNVVNAAKAAIDRLPQFVQNALGAIVGMISNFNPIIKIGLQLPDIIGSLNNLKASAKKMGIALPFANGTDFAPGGMALVGERGPELVYLPRGSQVKTAQETAGIMGGGGGISIGPVYVRSESDIDSLAHRLSFSMKTRGNL